MSITNPGVNVLAPVHLLVEEIWFSEMKWICYGVYLRLFQNLMLHFLFPL